jgi:hypothetical protein
MASTTVSTTTTKTVTIHNNNSLTVTGSGDIATGSTGIAVIGQGSIGTLTNNGHIEGGMGLGGIGIQVAGSLGTLTNAGMISGGSAAIAVGGNLANLDNQTSGFITGNSAAAISAGSIGTLTNEGSISSDNNAIDDSGNLTFLDNAGAASIIGHDAINVSGSIGTLTNEGEISANSGGNAVQANGIDLLHNTYTIGGGNIGILDFGNLTNLDNATGASITGNTTGIKIYGNIGTLTNEGTIHGGHDGIFAQGTADIENAGTISGGTDAIELHSAHSTLTLESGSIINGSVEDNAFDGSLILSGATTITGIGSQYTGFSTISLDTQDATIEGNAAGLASGQTITGYQYGDTIKLDNFAAISETYVAGTGLILTDASSHTETLNIAGGYGAGDFAIATNGTNTIVTDPTITIGSSITSQVDLGPAQNLIVTNSGTIITGSTAVLAGASIGTITNSGDISGLAYGIDVSGSILSLTNNGTIAGGLQITDYAINAGGNLGTLSNSGTILAYVAINVAGTITSLDNSGFIGGVASAVYAGALSSLNNSTSSTISSSETAINVGGTIGTLTNEGSITGGAYDGISVYENINDLSNSGTISGPHTGIAAIGGIGQLTNTGSISGGSNAISVNAIGTLTNNGNITGGQNAILDGGDLTSLDNTGSGTISGGSYGLRVEGSIGTLTNAGNIATTNQPSTNQPVYGQSVVALYANGGISSLSNSGIISSQGTGIADNAEINTLTNNGTISGRYYGLRVEGSIGTLANAGSIATTNQPSTSQTVYGQSVVALYANGNISSLTNSGTISSQGTGIADNAGIDNLINTGSITGGIDGLNVNAIGTLTNSGTISGGSNNGILDGGNLASLDNQTNATISGGTYGLCIEGSIGTLTNKGSITATGQLGVGVYANTAITSLTNSGLIQGGQFGVGVEANSAITSLTNSGIIEGWLAIRAPGWIETLTNEGTISSAPSGAAVLAGAIGSLINMGTIGGGIFAIDVSGTLTSLNNESGASITGNTAILVGTGPSAAMQPGSIGTLTNDGMINGGSVGIRDYGYMNTLDNTTGGLILGVTAINVAGSIGILTNAGTISATGSDVAVQAGSIGTLINDGTISGGAAIAIIDGNLGSLDNAASGTISGTGTAIRVGGTIGTLTNEGSITGNGRGIFASSDIGDLDNSGNISGRENAVTSYGSIGILTNEGRIAASSSSISANGIGTLTNSGDIIGGISDYGNLTSLDNTANASISGGSGIESSNAIFVTGNLTSVTNAINATISGNYGAIVVYGAIGTLTNDGSISDGGSGIAIQAGAIGTLTNDGTIEGGISSGDAIFVSGTIGSLMNGGSIKVCPSNTYDIAAINAQSIGTLTNSGTISGGEAQSGFAINLSGDLGTLTNSGTIEANQAIFVNGTITSISNAGTIESRNGGIHAGGDLTSLDNAAGAVIHGYTAIDIGAAIGNLSNSGTISSVASYSSNGIAVHAGSIGTVTNDGTITGGKTAINVNNNVISLNNGSGGLIKDYDAISISGSLATLTNHGIISASATANNGFDIAISAASIGTMTNSGIISANSSGRAVVAGAIGTLTNDGRISGGYIGIYDIGTLTSLDNAASATISGQSAALRVDGSIGTLTNEGQISGSKYAIHVGGNASLANSGTIYSDQVAIVENASLTSLDNVAGGVIQGGFTAIDVSGSIGSLTNDGAIITTFTSGDGVRAGSIGTLTNDGTISGATTAIDVNGTIGTLTNESSIRAKGGGYDAVQANSLGTVTNAGTIGGGGIGIADDGTTSLDNQAGAAITGSVTGIEDYGSIGTLTNEGSIRGNAFGILVKGTAHIENAGTIGGGAEAIQFYGANSTLTLDPTSVMNGNVSDQASGGTLVLAGSSANTVTGIGTQYTGFATIDFANADATAEGSIAGLASGQTIAGMEIGDTIKLDGFAAVSENYVAGTGLILTDANSNTETLDITGSYITQDFQLSNDGTNTTITDVEPLCFLPGTLILTPTGEIPVEDLRVGDSVVTLNGKARPIRWIGHGSLLTPAGRRGPATPVCIRRGALADNVPHRDLYVTKGHALYLHGVLIPAEFLVNHRTILWDDRGQEVRFYHIELEGHEILRANGAPAESYRDEANRWMFANANPAWDQPGVAPFAPVLTGGPRVDAVWQHLLERSGANLNSPTTTEPDLHLLIDGTRVEASRLTRDTYSFVIPDHASRIAIASRAAAPDVLGTFRDPRRLGVAITRIVLWYNNQPHIIDADDEALANGFHNYEPEEGCRWTNGHALLPVSLSASAPQILHLNIRHTTRYEAPEAASSRHAA